MGRAARLLRDRSLDLCDFPANFLPGTQLEDAVDGLLGAEGNEAEAAGALGERVVHDDRVLDLPELGEVGPQRGLVAGRGEAANENFVTRPSLLGRGGLGQQGGVATPRGPLRGLGILAALRVGRVQQAPLLVPRECLFHVHRSAVNDVGGRLQRGGGGRRRHLLLEDHEGEAPRGPRAPRGFAFVVFKEEVAAAAAAAALEAAPHVIDGRTVDVKKALPRDEQGRLLHPADAEGGENSEAPERSARGGDAALLAEASAAEKARARHKIFIGGLAATCDEAALRAYFSEFGEIKDSVVMYDPLSKRSRGFGFIAFSTEEAVDSVFKLGPRQEICGKVAEIKRAVPKEPGSPTHAQNGRRSSGRRSRGRARGRGGSGPADTSLAAPKEGSPASFRGAGEPAGRGCRHVPRGRAADVRPGREADGADGLRARSLVRPVARGPVRPERHAAGDARGNGPHGANRHGSRGWRGVPCAAPPDDAAICRGGRVPGAGLPSGGEHPGTCRPPRRAAKRWATGRHRACGRPRRRGHWRKACRREGGGGRGKLIPPKPAEQPRTRHRGQRLFTSTDETTRPVEYITETKFLRVRGSALAPSAW